MDKLVASPAAAVADIWDGASLGAGIPAFYTPTAVGTSLATGKDVRYFDGRPYVSARSYHGKPALTREQVVALTGMTLEVTGPLGVMQESWGG
jgi:hypothetical protein